LGEPVEEIPSRLNMSGLVVVLSGFYIVAGRWLDQNVDIL
jgi:hypothetical protein